MSPRQAINFVLIAYLGLMSVLFNVISQTV